MLLKAAVELVGYHDALVYHLPAALSKFNATTYEFPPAFLAEHIWLEPMVQSHPPLVHFVQGALYQLTGHLSAATSANAIFLGAFFAFLWARYQQSFPYRWLLTFFACMPLFMIHLNSGYIDLATGLSVTAALCALTWVAQAPTTKNIGLFIGAATIAMLCKIQAWPILFITCVAYAVILGYHFLQNRLSAKKALICLLIAAVLMGAWPTRNLITFGNPTYPFESPGFSSYIGDKAAEHTAIRNTPAQLQKNPTSINYVISYFELTRLFTAEPMRRSIGQGSGGPQSLHHRIGGLNGLLSGLVFFSLISAYRFAPRHRLAIAALGGLFVFTSFMPQSHEMRYWLAIPIAAAVLLTRTLTDMPYLLASTVKVLCLVIFLMSYIPTSPLDPKREERQAGPHAYLFSILNLNKLNTSPKHHPPNLPDYVVEQWHKWENNPSRGGCIPKAKTIGETKFYMFYAGPSLKDYHISDICSTD